jgi:hypothetical protein
MHDLKTNDGYNKRFRELVAEKRNERAPMKNALNCVESELREQHGVMRYSTYLSFSASKSRNPHRARFRPIKTV